MFSANKVTGPVLIATGNLGKLREINMILRASMHFKDSEILSLNDFPKVEAPIESASSFRENAMIKANYYYDKFNITVLVEDSGFCVEKLNGLPGVDSANWGQNGDFAPAIDKIYSMLDGSPSRAFFECVAVLKSFYKTYVSSGRVDGEIAPSPKGSKGFGFDSCFIPSGETKTFAQMDTITKNLFSHRKRALENLIEMIK